LKKLFILLLVISLTLASLYFMPSVLTSLSSLVPKDPQDSEVNFRYTLLEDGTVKIISYSGPEKTFEIPTTIGGHPVSTLGEFAFYYKVPLQQVTIPDAITILDANPFLRCEELTKISVSSTHPTLTVVDGALIDKTRNMVVSFPRAFTPVIIPENISAIGDFAYSSCDSLTGVVIPEGVESIGKGAFYYCTALTSASLPEGVASVGSEAFMECTALSRVNIPSSVTSIGSKAFYRCKALTTLAIPDSVTSIGRDAFLACYALTLSVGKGSFAEQYAIENKIPYVYASPAA